MKRSSAILLTAVFVLLIASACTSTKTDAVAVLTAPQPQTQVVAGSSFRIEGKVQGAGVVKVQVLVNNQPIAIIDQADETGAFPLTIDYQVPPASLAGSSVVQIKGFNAQDVVVVSSEPVFIQVQALVLPTATPAPMPTQPSVSPTPVQAAPTEAAAPTVAPNRVTNVENDKVNLRKGPGTGYEIVGQLMKDESALVKAKSADGTWWQIEFAAGEKGLAWVIGELVQFKGDAAGLLVVKVAPPAEATAADVPLATATPAPPAAPTTAPSALLPYSQADSFSPRNDIGDVPLGHNGEGNASKWTWTINGAQRAELEVSAPNGVPDVYDCPQGNLSGLQPNSAAGKRISVNLPTGEFAFTLTEKGYYVFTMYVTKVDGSQTTIPRAVVYGCYKKPGR